MAQKKCPFSTSIPNNSNLRTESVALDNFYNDPKTWIPYQNNNPLMNPPVTEIQVAYHVFLNNTGTGTGIYTNDQAGRNNLIEAVDIANRRFSGFYATSDVITVLVPIPNGDSKIRLSLGENNSRIYFYNNSVLNQFGNNLSTFRNYINQNFPNRNERSVYNMYVTAGIASWAPDANAYVESYASYDLEYNHQTALLNAVNSNQYSFGASIAHEVGHSLDLGHLFDGAETCICLNQDYLKDVFNDCIYMCPLNPVNRYNSSYNNSIPNAHFITNNVMAGTPDMDFYTPMQFGRMYKTIALKSMGKYVKKETYSSIPLVITTSELWDFNIKLFRDVSISAGAVLTISSNFSMPYNGKITVNSGAALVINGAFAMENLNTIDVKFGGTLKFTNNANFTSTGNGYIEVQNGGYFCIENNAKINLKDYNSMILLNPSYISGCNPVSGVQGNCISNPIIYTKTGLGEIRLISNSSFVQNETISSDRFITGYDILCGYDVTNLKSYGLVKVTNNSKVFIKNTNSVLLKNDFEVQLGSELEIK